MIWFYENITVPCKGKTSMFFVGEEKINLVEKAKAICKRCPVKVECLCFAIREQIPYGIYGGQTASERLWTEPFVRDRNPQYFDQHNKKLYELLNPVYVVPSFPEYTAVLEIHIPPVYTSASVEQSSIQDNEPSTEAFQSGVEQPHDLPDGHTYKPSD
jgi:hypothetical protein